MDDHQEKLSPHEAAYKPKNFTKLKLAVSGALTTIALGLGLISQHDQHIDQIPQVPLTPTPTAGVRDETNIGIDSKGPYVQKIQKDQNGTVISSTQRLIDNSVVLPPATTEQLPPPLTGIGNTPLPSVIPEKK